MSISRSPLLAWRLNPGDKIIEDGVVYTVESVSDKVYAKTDRGVECQFPLDYIVPEETETVSSQTRDRTQTIRTETGPDGITRWVNSDMEWFFRNTLREGDVIEATRPLRTVTWRPLQEVINAQISLNRSLEIAQEERQRNVTLRSIDVGTPTYLDDYVRACMLNPYDEPE